MLLRDNRYYQFVREERLFCAALAHLLMQRGPNLQTFLELVNSKPESCQQLPTAGLEQAEVYVEFAFLRDYWWTLEDNIKKRNFIFERLAQVDALAGFKSNDFSHSISEFNGFFVGSRGKAIKDDIVNPGHWSVTALSKGFPQTDQDEVFKYFCKFKWAFNIKPDLVILVPGAKPICIEAKLESKERQYPNNYKETKIFDERFGPGQGRVGQLEEQAFMFAKLLSSPCQHVVIGRDCKGYTNKKVPFLSWVEVFKSLSSDGSTPFIHKLIQENLPLHTLPVDKPGAFITPGIAGRALVGG